MPADEPLGADHLAHDQAAAAMALDQPAEGRVGHARHRRERERRREIDRSDFHAVESVSVRDGARRRSDLILVGLLQLVVLPHDERLAAQPAEELLHLRLLARAVDPLGDEVAHAVERLRRSASSSSRA